LEELSVYRCGLGAEGVCLLVNAAAKSPTLRSLNAVANGQHLPDWTAKVGKQVAAALRDAVSLRVLTVSCPEAELEAAGCMFEGIAGSCRVILVPNEQNNYNRALFSGHAH